jgi:hypothetical protein
MYAVFIPVGTAKSILPVPSLNLATELPILGVPQSAVEPVLHVPLYADGLARLAVDAKVK